MEDPEPASKPVPLRLGFGSETNSNLIPTPSKILKFGHCFGKFYPGSSLGFGRNCKFSSYAQDQFKIVNLAPLSALAPVNKFCLVFGLANNFLFGFAAPAVVHDFFGSGAGRASVSAKDIFSSVEYDR